MNKYIKKSALFLALLIITSALLCSFVGCGDSKGKNDKIKIVCTVFPLYDWMKNITGDSQNVELSLLVANGTDLHSYEPTVTDIISIKDCDMIVYVGGTSDTWVTEALENNPSKSRKELALIEHEEIIKRQISDECLLVEETHNHEHDSNGDNTDEHIWLSPLNAKASCSLMAEMLISLDGENKELYEKNLDDYLSELDSLYNEFKALSSEKPLIFADRFPFVYLCEDIGLSYYAAFSGCTSEADASFQTVVKLADRAVELDSKYIFVTETSDKKLAETVIETAKLSNIQIKILDSLQSVNEKRIKDGESYLSIMKKNLSVLKDSLS